MTDALEIKNCPCCNSAQVRTEMTITEASVWCKSCGLRITRQTIPDDSSGLVALGFAIAAWNRRAEPVSVQEADTRVAAAYEAAALRCDAMADEVRLAAFMDLCGEYAPKVCHAVADMYRASARSIRALAADKKE